MNKYKVLSILFALAACCYIAGAINHIVNIGEGVISSIFLAFGCLCASYALYKMK